jgi:hypothetical protein
MNKVVGMAGFEPTTFRSQSGRATKLRHIPCGEKSTGRGPRGPTPVPFYAPDRLTYCG